MPQSKHYAADRLLVAEMRKNQEQLKDKNTFFDPLLAPQQPFLLSSGVKQPSGMDVGAMLDKRLIIAK